MTNEMLSVNGLKYLFNNIVESPLDSLIEMSYDVLIMISRKNEMISFVSFCLILDAELQPGRSVTQEPAFQIPVYSVCTGTAFASLAVLRLCEKSKVMVRISKISQPSQD
jgi:hypothetical protein